MVERADVCCAMADGVKLLPLCQRRSPDTQPSSQWHQLAGASVDCQFAVRWLTWRLLLLLVALPVVLKHTWNAATHSLLAG
jgi:hypothetical protein